MQFTLNSFVLPSSGPIIAHDAIVLSHKEDFDNLTEKISQVDDRELFSTYHHKDSGASFLVDIF